ncbi:MAG: nucleoside triphosphate pyrophosphohydrolase [Treponema sp.]|nr:nucleoside triphosphate pyrophosphohydrolase [Treponema sp.]
MSITPEQAFKRLYDTVMILRSPGGCAWDLDQTPLSIRSNLIEECYELLEAIDEGDIEHIKEELGDVFLVGSFFANIYEQEGQFSTAEMLEGLSDKLVRRHPHVFAGETPVEAATPEEALASWTKMKIEKEGRKPSDSIMDDVSRGLPPFDRAYKLQKKAAKAGFDWPDAAGVIEKIREELEEVRAVVGGGDCCGALTGAGGGGASRGKLEEELGDLLFSVINLCRYFKIEPAHALIRTNKKFIERFKHVEARMKEGGIEMKAANLEVMDRYWNEMKGEPE